MTKKLKRLDAIKEPRAKVEIALAHTMIALLALISISLLWALRTETTTVWTIVVTVLLGFIVVTSTAVVVALWRSLKTK